MSVKKKPSAVQRKAGLQYEIRPVDPAGHLFEVRIRIATPAAEGQQLWLPAWIPGSYLIRDFARNIVTISAKSRRKTVALTKLDKDTWQADALDGPLEIVYQVYSWDLSVRGAHLDQTHGFFNGTSVFLAVTGQENARCDVTIHPPRGRDYKNWRVATTLPRAGARLWGFGRYKASNYDELIDHPVEMGTFDTAGFSAGGARHEIVITGAHDTDFDRLISDLKPVCEAQIALFDPKGKRAPVSRYLFLTTTTADGYGGLEHRASTALICARKDLPYRGMSGTPDGYQTFLGLASHEYFHTWNVKRVKPAEFAPYKLNTESYTELLWVFEGFTSYYDDLMLVRGGAITEAQYLKLLSRNISNVQRGPGRLLQSVAQSSFDAWTRFYKQDENAANAIVSYYSKGAMVALALDLTIRAKSRHRRSLDDVMRLLWQRFGRDFFSRGAGVGENDMQWVHGTADIPLATLFRPFGITVSKAPADKRAAWLGARPVHRAGRTSLGAVYSGGPAHEAGLSASDEIIACNDQRISSVADLDRFLSRSKPGNILEITVFRGDMLHRFDVSLTAPPDSAVELSTTRGRAKTRAAKWLAS
jgi:predicted metalloprotease with PDZ domain